MIEQVLSLDNFLFRMSKSRAAFSFGKRTKQMNGAAPPPCQNNVPLCIEERYDGGKGHNMLKTATISVRGTLT